MAYPPNTLGTNRTNTTVSADNHPTDHNDVNGAVNDIVTELGTNPSGGDTDVTTRLTNIESNYQLRSEKGAANGYASLGASTVVPTAQLGSGTANSTTFLRGDNTWQTVSTGPDTPWGVNHDAGGFNLTNLGLVSQTPSLGTFISGETIVGHEMSPTATFATTAGGDWITLHSTPVITANANMDEIVGLQLQATVNGSATSITQVHGIEALTSLGANAALVRGIWAQIGVGFGTTTLGIGLDVEGFRNSFGTFTTFTGVRIRSGITAASSIGTVIGLDITNLAVGTTKWGMQIGNYQSYHQGPLAIGGTTAPTWDLHLQRGNSAQNAIGMKVSTTGPTAPSSNDAGTISIYKGATNYYFLITFNDGGTTRYRYIQLNGTAATWTQNTSLPT